MSAPRWLDRTEFPFSPRSVDVGDGALSVTDVGQGPAVLFSHGTPTWSLEWRHLVRGLSGQFRCLAPDHLGFGLSPRPAGADYRPEAHARRFRRLVEALGLERYHLVVHDFGGPIALDGALDEPGRLDRLVVFNSFLWPFTDQPRTRRMARLAGGGLFRWLYRNVNLSFVISRSAWGAGPRPPEVWRQYTQVFPDADSREQVLWALARSLEASTPFFRSLWERRERLADTPVHLVWGLADTAFGPDALARFREAWPRATVAELPRAGHWPHEEEPERCLEEVRGFLLGGR